MKIQGQGLWGNKTTRGTREGVSGTRLRSCLVQALLEFTGKVSAPEQSPKVGRAKNAPRESYRMMTWGQYFSVENQAFLDFL